MDKSGSLVELSLQEKLTIDLNELCDRYGIASCQVIAVFNDMELLGDVVKLREVTEKPLAALSNQEIKERQETIDREFFSKMASYEAVNV